jgi:hypothetical protein
MLLTTDYQRWSGEIWREPEQKHTTTYTATNTISVESSLEHEHLFSLFGEDNDVAVVCPKIGGSIKKMHKKRHTKKRCGGIRDSNPGPLAPKARIIPLDQFPNPMGAKKIKRTHFFWKGNLGRKMMDWKRHPGLFQQWWAQQPGDDLRWPFEEK